jgi:hypothetical protein
VKVRIRKTGEILEILGPPPKRGDVFLARGVVEPVVVTCDPPPRTEEGRRALAEVVAAAKRLATEKAGCTLGENPDGSRYFSCRRGRAASPLPAATRDRTFRFDPELHELVP